MANPNPVHKFQKGESGNPKGRPPRKWTMTGLIESALEEQHNTGVPYRVFVAKKLVDLASRGDLGAIKEINNRLDGMPKQDINVKEDVKVLITLDTKKE